MSVTRASYPRIRRVALAVFCVLTLSQCAQNPVSGDRDFVLMSEQQEIRMGAQAHEQVLGEYPALDHPALQAYVNAVGQRLAAHSHRPGLKWHFTVVDSPDVNAFALPGGYVYITRGLLAFLNSEAELAGVLGHEIGHVTARHGVRQQSAATVATGGAILGSILLPGMDNQAGATLMQTMARAWTAGYGREHELEADRLGAVYLAKAGYDPRAMIEVIEVLKNQERFEAEQARREGREARSHHGAFATHPGNELRLRLIIAEASKHAVAQPRVGREDYLRQLDGVVFGDSAEQGVIRNNALLHDKLGLMMQFPQGWRVQNRPDRVIARNPQGDALLELTVAPRNKSPLATLQQGLKLDAGARYESGTLGGEPAAFVAGTLAGKPVIAASVVLGGKPYLVAGMAKDRAGWSRERAALRGAINSFRAITEAERHQARPHVLRILAAPAGASMATLAQQSPLGATAESKLRLMNDLYPAGEPQPGQLLKIVQPG